MTGHATASADPQALVLTGGAPRLLPEGPALWQVVEGRAELFLEHDQGRRFLLHAPSGDLVFALDAAGAGLSVGGTEGTCLKPLDPGGADAERLGAAAESWVAAIGRLFEGLPLASAAPGSLELRPSDERLHLPADSLLRAAGGQPLWVMLPAVARVRIEATEVILDGPAALPLAGALQLRLLDETTLWTGSSRDLGSPEQLLRHLADFNACLPALLRDLARARGAHDLERLAERRGATERQVTASLGILTRATTSPSERPLPSSARLGPAGAAVAAVLDHIGIAADPARLLPRAVGRSAQAAAALADVPAIARNAGARSRRVLLGPDWQRQDLGPLVGAWEDSRRPVALLPAAGRGYRLFDPQSGRLRALTARDADAIAPTAYAFYRPLPEVVAGAGAIAGFLWAEVGRDGVVAGLAGAAAGLLGTVIPIVTGIIIDTVIPSNETLLLAQLGVALGLAALVSFVFTVVREIALHRINGRTEASLQAAVWDRLLRLPAIFFRDYNAGGLAQRIAGLEAVRGALLEVALGATLTFTFSLFNVALLLFYSPPLAAIAAGLVLLLALVTFAVGLFQIRYGRRIAALDGELSGLVFQYLQGVTKLRVAGAEPRAFARWAERYAEERLARVRAGALRNHFESFSGAYQVLSLALIYAATAWLASDTLSPGMFIAFLAAYGAFQAAFVNFANAAIQVFAALPQYERARPLLAATVESDASRADPGTLSGTIEASGITFGYESEGRRLFDGLDLAVRPGESVALVGPSGSGKSSLLRLLLGFETPQAGAILYDGQELQSLDLSLLRRQIGVVLQSGRVFAGSILDNIRGAAELTIEDCEQAARAAGLDQDLAQMPMGLHTPLTEGASTLSGGQRQRILIARALASRPRILFLDEATSALDNRTQSIVTATLDSLGVTRVVVAHRLSTVRNADRICFIDQGRIVEEGSYDQLMAADGRFAAFAQRQLL